LAEEETKNMPDGSLALPSCNLKDSFTVNVGDLLAKAQPGNSRDVYRLIESRSGLNLYQDQL